MRWYDAHPSLSRGLESLRTADPRLRRAVVGEALAALQLLAGNVLERHVDGFPLDLHRRRWYDDEPELWMLVNGLQHVGTTCQDTVADILRVGLSRAAA
jgi:hypothetical protein